MPSLFAAADALSSAAVDFVYGEPLRLLPRVQGGYTTGGGPDPDRWPVDFLGTLSGALGAQDSAGDRRGSDFRGGEVTTRDRTVTADILNWPTIARIGDHIMATSQPGAPTYEIVGEPLIDGMNRYIVPMVNAQ